jgi:hypothetical protein
LSAPRPTPKLEDHLFSAVRDCLFNTFAAIFHIGGRSCIRNPRMCHSVVTGTLLSWSLTIYCDKTNYRHYLLYQNIREIYYCSTSERYITAVHPRDILLQYIREIYYCSTSERYITAVHPKDMLLQYIRMIYYCSTSEGKSGEMDSTDPS